jgi:uncharacterized protein YfiM (DUF2279 family)
MIKKLLVGISIALCLGVAQAKCIANDPWTGADKRDHLAFGAGIATMATLMTNNEAYGFAAGSLAGIAKEAYDARGNGTCSLQDALVTIGGAYLGSKIGGVLLIPQRSGVQVSYVKTF